MKKRKWRVLSAIAALIFGLLMFTGCSEAEVTSRLTIYSDLSGTKEVVIRVYGDEESLGGRDYTAGNNTAFMLTQGEALAEKLEEFCKLDGVKISVLSGAGKKDSTYIRMKFDFEDIADYNAKAKVIAGKYGVDWIDATLTQSGDTITVREAASNLPLLYLDMLEQYFNDFDCYPVYEYGPNTQSQMIPNGVQFQGDDMYSFSWWVVPTSAEIVVGAETSKNVYFKPEEDYEHREDLSGKFTEASGVPASRPTVSSIAVKDGIKTQYKKGETFSGGVLLVTYSDSSAEEAVITGDMISGFDTSSAGNKTVTVNYGGKTVSYDITVTDPQAEEKPDGKPEEEPAKKGCGAEVSLAGGMPVYGYVLIALGCVLVVGAATALLMWRKKR